MVQNRRVVLASRPKHEPTEDNFKIETSDVDLSGSSLKEGEILVKTLWASIDPYTRASMGLPGDTARAATYQMPQFKDSSAILEIGDIFGGRCAGVVVKSKNPRVEEGDLVCADWKWVEYAIFDPNSELTFELMDKSVFTAEKEAGKICVSAALGALGVSGSHAYFGYKCMLHPKKGETLVVSSAAGNIGVVVGQIGKVKGVRTVGIAGGKKAEELVTRNVYDVGVDYRSANGNVEELVKKLKQACPNGIDAYYDNARGFISEAVYHLLNPGARVYICGGVSEYNDGTPLHPYSDAPQKEGVKVHTGMELSKLYVFNIPEARYFLNPLVLAGKIQIFEHITEGFENLPKAFVGMYKGENFGKAVVKV
eukprot:Phypoly_transcript_12069.p1 GENE.Phypoly_transcript_12069~~Phypoly_transcript_12069.p1  ORF type:complete len:367 (+),score=66.78 Phypoly_transcript_12069:31-1131(+)